jgi:hypothetical protein
VLLGHVDGDQACLEMIKKFIWNAETKGLIKGRGLCLELACGGALLLYKNVLIDIFNSIDINEFSPKQMKATYDTEMEIL